MRIFPVFAGVGGGRVGVTSDSPQLVIVYILPKQSTHYASEVKVTFSVFQTPWVPCVRTTEWFNSTDREGFKITLYIHRLVYTVLQNLIPYCRFRYCRIIQELMNSAATI